MSGKEAAGPTVAASSVGKHSVRKTIRIELQKWGGGERKMQRPALRVVGKHCFWDRPSSTGPKGKKDRRKKAKEGENYQILREKYFLKMDDLGRGGPES